MNISLSNAGFLGSLYQPTSPVDSDVRQAVSELIGTAIGSPHAIDAALDTLALSAQPASLDGEGGGLGRVPVAVAAASTVAPALVAASAAPATAATVAATTAAAVVLTSATFSASVALSGTLVAVALPLAACGEAAKIAEQLANA